MVSNIGAQKATIQLRHLKNTQDLKEAGPEGGGGSRSEEGGMGVQNGEGEGGNMEAQFDEEPLKVPSLLALPVQKLALLVQKYKY